MDFTHQLIYAATPEAVLAMLQDPNYWKQVAAAVGARECTAAVTRDGATVTVVVDQLQEVAGVPGFAKKFVGDHTQAVRTQVWEGRTSTVELATPGKPTRISGRAEVREQAAGSVLVYDLDVRASVPLVGGKLEKLVADLTAKGFDEEGAVGATWLEDR